jgi:hypothetical protein
VGREAAQRVAKYRERLNAHGLRPVQVWAVDSRRPGLADLVARQCLAVNRGPGESDALDLIDALAVEIEGWE